MATGDKLVNLDALKLAYDNVYNKTQADQVIAQSAATKVSKTGDTMTGVLRNKTSIIDSSASSSTNEQVTVLELADNSDYQYGALRGVQTSDGSTGLAMIARRSVNGSNAVRTFGMKVSPNGTTSYDISSPEAFLKELRLYRGVSQLGFTAGSASVLDVYRAMPEASKLICTGTEFASGEVPVSASCVEIVKRSSDGSRGYIHLYGKASTDYRMYLGASSYNGNDVNAPSGVWHAIPDLDGLGSAVSGTIERNESITIPSVFNAILYIVRQSFAIYGIANTNTVVPLVSVQNSVTVTISNNNLTIANGGNTCVYMLQRIRI